MKFHTPKQNPDNNLSNQNTNSLNRVEGNSSENNLSGTSVNSLNRGIGGGSGNGN